MTDDPLATGVLDVVLVDALLGLDVDLDEVIAMTPDERLRAVGKAVEKGRLPADRLVILEELGAVPP